MNHLQYEFACAKEWERKHPKSKVLVTPKGDFGADGGIDLIIETPNGKMLGQCKHYNENGVIKRLPVKEIRALKGVMAREKIEKGVFFSSIKFSQKSWKEAKEDNIWIEYFVR